MTDPSSLQSSPSSLSRSELESLEHIDARRWKELFFEFSSTGCVVSHPATQRCIRVNRRFAALLGYEPEELTGRSWLELTHEADRESDLLLYAQLLRGDIESYTLRKRYLERSGEIVHADIEVRALRDANGEIELLVAMVHDATDEVRRLEELERQRLRSELLSNATRAIMWSTDASQLAGELGDAIRSTLGPRAIVVDVCVREQPSVVTNEISELTAALRTAAEAWTRHRGRSAPPPAPTAAVYGFAIDASRGAAEHRLFAAGARQVLGRSVSAEGREVGALLLALGDGAAAPALEQALDEIAQEFVYALERRALERDRVRIASELAQAVLALEASPVVLYRAKLSPSFPITFVSSNAARFGFDVQSVREGKLCLFDIVHPDDASRVRAEAEELFASGLTEATQRYRVVTPNGAVLEVEDDFRLLPIDEHGEVTVEGVLRDVTASAEAKRALERSELKYRELFDLSPLPMWVFDVETLRFLEVNRAATEHYGYSREEFLARTILDIRPADEEGRVRASIDRLRGGFDRSGVWRHEKRDGTLIQVEITTHALEFYGRPAELLLANDVTARESAEARARDAILQLERTLHATVDAVARMVEVRDPYTAGHERRVSELSVAFGRAMGLDEKRLEGLRIGGYVHDVGKIAVPAEILAKPTRLTKMEFEIIKAHAERGYAILQPINFPWPVAEMARQHHERVDGSGYPQGLRGDAILLEARILAVADVVESMASDRPYRPGLGLAAALEEIEKNRGKLYDVDVADACLGLFRSGALELPR